MSDTAKALMNNEAFKNALETAQKDYINAAMNCPLDDDEGRRLFLSAARTVQKIGAHIAAVATDKTGQVIEIPNFYEERARARWKTLADLRP